MAERLAAMAAPATKAPEAAAPTGAAPTSVVLATPVWLDALRIPEGPPAALFDELQRHRVAVLRSDVLLDEVEGALRQLGWADDAIAAARERITGSTVVSGDQGGDAVAIANAAGLDAVYTVGPSTGQQRDGVTLRPVHELLTLLQRVTA